MTLADDQNNRSLSTTTTWKWAKIRSAPRRQAQSTAAGRSFRALPWRNPRQTLTVKVTYRGGAQAWIELQARGSVMRVTGDTAIFDVLRDVWQWEKHPKSRR